MGWPNQHQGCILGLSSPTLRWSWNGKKVCQRPLSQSEKARWQEQVQRLEKEYLTLYQIVLRPVQLMIHYMKRYASACPHCHQPVEYVTPIQTLISNPAPFRHPYSRPANKRPEGCWGCKS